MSKTALIPVDLSVPGIGVGYAASITAARIPGPAALENYAVATASMSLLGDTEHPVPPVVNARARRTAFAVTG